MSTIDNPTQSETPPGTPSPLDMPGAQTAAPATATDAAQPSAPAATPEVAAGWTAEKQADYERLQAIHKDEKKWENRAKENFSAREQLDRIAEALTGSKPEQGQQFDAQAEITKLRQEASDERAARVRAEVASTTGVPADMLAGSTREELEAAAQRQLSWAQGLAKQAGVPLAANAGQVNSTQATHEVQGPRQIQSRDELKGMTSAQIMDAFRKGQLQHLGASPN